MKMSTSVQIDKDLKNKVEIEISKYHLETNIKMSFNRLVELLLEAWVEGKLQISKERAYGNL